LARPDESDRSAQEGAGEHDGEDGVVFHG
jgi:hypothetical protein